MSRQPTHILAKATWGNKKRQKYPEGQLFNQLYQEEHVEELAIKRKVKEEEARRKHSQMSQSNLSPTSCYETQVR